MMMSRFACIPLPPKSLFATNFGYLPPPPPPTPPSPYPGDSRFE